MTRQYTTLLAIILLIAAITISGQSAVSRLSTMRPAYVPSAEQVVKAACKEAASSHRKVFIIFHASWCGWCHQMDSLMTGPACKKLFTDHYVIDHLVIMENGDKKSLENPGAKELYTKYAGENGQGIPFWLIIDPNGTVLADSRNKRDGGAAGTAVDNVGCPSEPAEVAYFVKVLHATSSLTDIQLDVIREKFTKRK